MAASESDRASSMGMLPCQWRGKHGTSVRNLLAPSTEHSL